MNISLKHTLANRVISRAKSGLYFIDECLQCIHTGETDGAYSRSIYILFSFNFELILKSRIMLARNSTTKEDLIKGLKHHNFELLSKELSSGELSDINIKKIQKTQNTDFVEYEVETTKGEKIIIQDIIDVRYDFTKDSLRDPDPQEAERMKKEINILLEMIKKIVVLMGES